MNTNYIPEWKSTPFHHIEYTLVRNQIQFDLLFDDVNDTDTLDLSSCSGCVIHYDKHCVVYIGDTTEYLSTLVHESVHIWQKLKKEMSEEKPSKEFEAYSIEYIFKDLMQMYKDSE